MSKRIYHEDESKNNIFVNVGDIENAYGLYLTFDDMTMFDNLRACNAKKKVDIAVKYNETVKEFTFDKFMNLLGF